MLYHVVQQHLATFMAHTDADPGRPGLPQYVRREFERFLSCGLLCKG